jgi:hypothetical protein
MRSALAQTSLSSSVKPAASKKAESAAARLAGLEPLSRPPAEPRQVQRIALPYFGTQLACCPLCSPAAGLAGDVQRMQILTLPDIQLLRATTWKRWNHLGYR